MMKTSKCKKHGEYTEEEAYVCNDPKYKDGIMLRCKKCKHEERINKYKNGFIHPKKKKNDYCELHGNLDESNAYVCNEKQKNGEIRIRFRCKECKKAERADQYLKNRELAIKSAGEWKKANRERVNAQVREDKKNNPEKYKKWNADYHERNRDKINIKAIARLHSIEVTDYEEMVKAQDNKCAICGKEETRMMRGKIMRLCVDHDHETGQIRSLLCHDCNSGLGKFLDSPDLLTMAAIYLMDWNNKCQ